MTILDGHPIARLLRAEAKTDVSSMGYLCQKWVPSDGVIVNQMLPRCHHGVEITRLYPDHDRRERVVEQRPMPSPQLLPDHKGNFKIADLDVLYGGDLPGVRRIKESVNFFVFITQ